MFFVLQYEGLIATHNLSTPKLLAMAASYHDQVPDSIVSGTIPPNMVSDCQIPSLKWNYLVKWNRVLTICDAVHEIFSYSYVIDTTHRVTFNVKMFI